MMNEHRINQRIRSYLKGEIVHSGGKIRIECTVRDLSPEGARIQVAHDITLPDPFELHIPLRGIVEKSHIVWRHGNETGVHFIRAAQNTSSAANPAKADRSVLARMEALENEMNGLRQQMAIMRAKLDHFTTDRG